MQNNFPKASEELKRISKVSSLDEITQTKCLHALTTLTVKQYQQEISSSTLCIQFWLLTAH